MRKFPEFYTFNQVITMAKIELSALVNRIRGKLSGTVLSTTKGINYLKRYNPKPVQHRTRLQAQIRGAASDLSGEWYSLSSTLKDLWQAYASMLPRPMSAINAYISLNQRLIHYFGTTAKRTAPPPTPATPEHVQGLSIIPKGTSDFCITWTKPTDANTHVVVNYRPLFGIERTTSQQWKFGAVAASNLLSARINTAYDAGTIIKFKVRTIDTYGRASPWMNVMQKTALYAGRYGYSSYGYAFYGP